MCPILLDTCDSGEKPAIHAICAHTVYTAWYTSAAINSGFVIVVPYYFPFVAGIFIVHYAHSIIRPVVLYGSEAWCLTANDEKNLCIWERKVLRKIFDAICVAGYWRSRTNEEVRQLYGELDIVTNKKRKIEMAGTCGEDE